MHLLLPFGGKLWLLQRPRLSQYIYPSFKKRGGGGKCPWIALGYAIAQHPGRDKICDCPTPGITIWANAPRLPGESLGTAEIDKQHRGHVVRILLNSLNCWSFKTFNHGLNHSKIHAARQVCDFQCLLFLFRQSSMVRSVWAGTFGKWAIFLQEPSIYG